MRIVLDTNVVVSAILWRGTPHRLLAAIGQHTGIQINSSPELIRELADVLGRPAVGKQLQTIGRTASALVADYVQALELVEPVSVPSVVPDDADDDHVIAAAVAAKADVIVSGDSHLLALKTVGRIEIVTPAEAIRRITVL